MTSFDIAVFQVLAGLTAASLMVLAYLAYRFSRAWGFHPGMPANGGAGLRGGADQVLALGPFEQLAPGRLQAHRTGRRGRHGRGGVYPGVEFVTVSGRRFVVLCPPPGGSVGEGRA